MRSTGKKRLIGGLITAALTFFLIQTRIRPALAIWEQQMGSFLGQLALAGGGVPPQYQALQTAHTLLWGLFIASLALAAWGWRRRSATRGA